uniref:Sugar phosphate transporter domain-containing protein n=1 Tax=Vitis vinifera TaxID=29760 RepID=A5BIF2_VITVI|nr:hypothetical protein VITISV_041269 [Vitis vinifera]
MGQIYKRSLIAALCFHAYQQVSYMILQRVSPVTHSVGNCVKRVVVIVTSVLFFRTPVSPVNSLDWRGPCWSVPVFKSEAHQAKDSLKFVSRKFVGNLG